MLQVLFVKSVRSTTLWENVHNFKTQRRKVGSNYRKKVFYGEIWGPGVCGKQGFDETLNTSITGGHLGEEELFVMKVMLIVLNAALIFNSSDIKNIKCARLCQNLLFVKKKKKRVNFTICTNFSFFCAINGTFYMVRTAKKTVEFSIQCSILQTSFWMQSCISY